MNREREITDNIRKLESIDNCYRKSISVASIFSSNSLNQKQHELFGFRRMARAYLLGYDENPVEEKRKLLSSYTNNNNYIVSNGSGSSLPTGAAPIIKRKRIDQNFLLRINQDPSVKTEKLHVTAELSDYSLNKQESNYLVYEDTDISTSTLDDFKEYPVNIKQLYKQLWKTDVVIKNIPHGTGISSIINQIFGGLLENVTLIYDTDNRLKDVKLKFQTMEDADAFMKYSYTNLFKVNGRRLYPQWEVKVPGEISSDNLLEQFTKNVVRPDGACRSLILKQQSHNNSSKSNSRERTNTIQELNITKIKQDFVNFGELLNIAPLISRKICLSINFLDVRSAMKAMEAYEDLNSDLHKKYFTTWSMWYGKDITDRTCIEL